MMDCAKPLILVAVAINAVSTPRIEQLLAAADPQQPAAAADDDAPAPVVLSGPVSAEEARPAAALQKPTQVNFVQVPLEDGIRFLQDYHVIQIMYDRAELKAAGVKLDSPITLAVAGISFQDVLRLILDPLGCECVSEDDALVITTRGAAKDYTSAWLYNVSDFVRAGIAAEDLAKAISATLRPEVALDGNRAAVRVEKPYLIVEQNADYRARIEKLLPAMLRELARKKIEKPGDEPYEERAYEIKDFPAHAPEAAKLLQVLTVYVGRPTWKEFTGRGTIRREGDRLLVSQSRRGHARLAEALERIRKMIREGTPSPAEALTHFQTITRAAAADEQPLLEALARPISFGIPRDRLEGAVEQLRRHTGAAIRLLPDELVEAGVTPNILVSLKASEEQSLAAALDTLLAPHKLDWFVDEGVVLITSRKIADQRMETCVYSIRDLVPAGQDPSPLVKKIRAADPAAWSAAGNLATTATLPGLLIVTHNRRGHDAVRKALEELR